MASRLRLFVSAAPDLEAEREVIGQAVAELPVSLGWAIKRTPKRGEPLTPALEAVEACDFYVLLFATDIRAPVGLEFYAARRAGKAQLAFLKDATRTPAARIFIRAAKVDWITFRSDEELKALIQKALAQLMLERAQAFALNLNDLEMLSAFLEGLGREEEARLPEEARGAREGGVIIAPGRDVPPGGVLVEG